MRAQAFVRAAGLLAAAILALGAFGVVAASAVLVDQWLVAGLAGGGMVASIVALWSACGRVVGALARGGRP